ncbi:MAG: cytochrome c family protein [Alphaproteobacteria bacterium]|nr:cytochrome c family protein [Alphaproteobacteria bacterium]MBL7098878.1 cytochrome c family protein [Alphaproteobacteria bacterium]
MGNVARHFGASDLMDSWTFNKIAGAVLGTLILVLVINFATEALFEVEKPAKEAYHVEGVVETASTGGASATPAAETIPDWGTVLPKADVNAGKDIATRCQQCHDISKGGPNKIGPELWGLLGRPRATEAGFSYSSAMSADHNPWTYDKLFQFTHQPQSFVPGTKMSFAGLRSADDRINLIAYLRTQEDTPEAIPAPAPAKPAAPAAPAPATPPKK